METARKLTGFNRFADTFLKVSVGVALGTFLWWVRLTADKVEVLERKLISQQAALVVISKTLFPKSSNAHDAASDVGDDNIAQINRALDAAINASGTKP